MCMVCNDRHGGEMNIHKQSAAQKSQDAEASGHHSYLAASIRKTTTDTTNAIS